MREIKCNYKTTANIVSNHRIIIVKQSPTSLTLELCIFYAVDIYLYIVYTRTSTTTC